MAKNPFGNKKITRVKKEKSKKVKPNITKKIVTFGIWGFIGIVFVSSLWLLLNTGKIISSNSAMKREIAELTKSVENLNKQADETDNLDVFNRYFVQSWYRTDLKQDEYQKGISEFLSKDIEAPSNANVKDKKELASIQLWKKEREDGQYKVSYLVSYRTKDSGKTGSELITFLVAEKDQKYGVVSYPYTQNVADFKTDGLKKAVNPLEEEEQVSAKEREGVQKWLADTFFPRFIETTNLDDVKYMMKDPYFLGGTQKFERIDSLKVYSENETKGLIAKVVVSVKDTVTQLSYKQEYSLSLTKESDGKYYVEKLTHSLEN